MTTDIRHPLSEHRLSLSAIASLGRFPLFICGTCMAAGFGLLLWEPTEDEPTLFCISSLLFGGGLIWLAPLFHAYLRSIGNVKIYEEGLEWSLHGHAQFRSWDDLHEVYRMDKKAYRFWRQSEMTVVFKKTQPVVLDQTLSDFFQMAALVEAIGAERLLPSYRQALDQETGACFGPIVLSRQGIRINEVDFLWAEIEEYAICNGGLVVTPFAYEDLSGEFVGFPEIPNYLILLRLLEELDKHPVPAYQCIYLVGRCKSTR